MQLCRQHGRALANEVNRLLAQPLKALDPRIAPLTTLEIPYDAPPLSELQATARKSYSAQRLLRLLQARRDPPRLRSYQIGTWLFGDNLAMVFLSDEVVVDYALRMRREFDGNRLWINAYSNEVSNYIVSKRLLREGGYEVNNSLAPWFPTAGRSACSRRWKIGSWGTVHPMLPAGFLAAPDNSQQRDRK